MIASLSGYTVLTLALSMPRAGAWTGTLEADTEVSLSGPVVLDLGVVSLHCCITRGDLDQGRFKAEIVGGAGKLGAALPAKFYRGAPLRLPLLDLAAECGETLSSTASEQLWLANVPQFWTRVAGTAGDALRELCGEAGAVWRFLPDGTLWAGTETWPAFTANYESMDENPSRDTEEIACDTALLMPGQTLGARKVSRVHHRLDKASFRSTAWFE